jgi:serine/threonine protein kinase/signal transduction histidine kinase
MIIDHRYEVIESLGSGTWSNVYKVQDKRTGTFYSLKLFQYLSSAEMYEKFTAEEMHHITKIEHPNLSHIVDFGHVGDHVYYISEYYDGFSLKNFKFKRMQVEFLFDIIIQILYALDALHGQDIIHKDLKPENILYRIDGNKVEVKVIDYGFAKIDQNKEQHIVSGTLPYIAPEVYINKQILPASDFYSLGVLLYRITTGSFPFSIEQINSLITGSQTYFIPKFPSELNADIPQTLEKFILKLLDRNPENRFSSAEEIIRYINRIQDKNYPYSIQWTLVNKLKFNSYISRAGYCHQVLDFIENVEENNGKIVSLIGSDGLGKENVLSLFRYHLLNNKYFLFDYTCSRLDHEPFFALIKEFMLSLTKDELMKYDELINISEKFKLYLFQSAKDAKKITQNQSDLKADFDSVKNLLLALSEQKPIIFIVRNAQFVHRYTIDFINYISPYIHNHRILVLLSFNDYHKANQIHHSIMMQLQPLSHQETVDYVHKLLNKKPSNAMINKVWDGSAGNPWFVREILVDWVQKGIISQDNDNETNFRIENYEVSSKIVNSIHARLNKISANNYKYMQLLSIIEFPFNKNVIKHILNASDKVVYDFIKDAVYSDVIAKEKQNYYFVYKEAKNKLKSELSKTHQTKISQEIIQFFEKTEIYDIETCKGLIKNSIVAENLVAQRDYTFRLYELYEERFDQDSAYDAILEVLKIDLSQNIDLPKTKLISDLQLFQEKTELTGFSNCSKSVIDEINGIPDIFEKHYTLGTIYFLREEIEAAKKEFDKALKLAVTGKQYVHIWLYYCQYYAQKDIKKMYSVLELFEVNTLSPELMIAYIDRLSVYYKIKGELLIAIKTAEDFLSDFQSVQDTKILIRLASLHNNLGVCYSLHKNIEESNVHLNIALTIWKRFNIKRYLGIIYNNIADLYLKQGVIPIAEDYSKKGYEVAEMQGIQSIMALAMLNLGEANIKKGNFKEAEHQLIKAKDIIDNLKTTKFLEAIQMNLALSKSKIVSFSYYFDFIRESEKKLINGTITEINPIVKTYFYYLYELGLSNKMTKLLSKNAHINFHEVNEDEFYYNSLSLISMLKKDYNQALEHLHNAVKFAGEVKNHYAFTVFSLSQIECYIGIGEYAKATEIIRKTQELCTEYKYKYWNLKLKLFNCVIDLCESNVSLRLILRSLMDLYAEAENNSYFIIKYKIMQYIIQLMNELNAENEASEWFFRYQEYLDEVTNGIEEEDKHLFLKENFYYAKGYKDVQTISIASRFKTTKSNWNDLQYSLLSIHNIDRIKFLIEKGIRDVIAPWKFQISIYSEKQNSYSIFLSDTVNGDIVYSPEMYLAIERAYKTDSIIIEELDNTHNMIVPLQIKYHKIGFMILSDRSELNFTKYELSMIKAIKLHITNLIMRIQDYSEITQKMNMMNRLMTITHSMLKVIDIKALELEIISSIVDFTGSSRGFLIKKDETGNYIYQIAMDYNKTPITNISVICKTVIYDCQYSLQPVFTYNALEDLRFKNSISVHDYKLHTIFCAPLIVNDIIYGFIYLDNYLDNSKSMYLNPEITTLLLDQINIALKNALQYKAIVDKSIEMQSLESLKDEFMAIVSHELNTPLTTLQGYISRLKRNLFSDDEERQDIINKIESSIKKLILTTNDIITMNNYNLKNELPKVKMQVSEILNLIHHEVEIVSRHRKMIIRSEVPKDLPEIDGNWEAIHLMIYNIVLNAIRFTNDFGTITIGARLSAFQQEKIDNNEALVIYVQDNGIGMPEYQLNNIFRKFYELNEIYAHKSGTTEYRSSGLGLGLATAKRIADLHHGKIWIKSKENEGTTVFISLPL